MNSMFDTVLAHSSPAPVRHAAHVSRLRSGQKAREQKRNKPWPTGPHQTNQTHCYRAQDATARAPWHGSELWSPFGTKRPRVQILPP